MTWPKNHTKCDGCNKHLDLKRMKYEGNVVDGLWCEKCVGWMG